ncbi:MAG: hypothetical protein ACLFVQ_11075 [Chitinispirillaceae bacterium]
MVLLPFFLFLCSCASEKEEVIRQKLDVVLNDDLEAIVDGVSEKGLIEKPYFEMIEYQTYDEGAYIRRAVVDFYFLRTVKRKIRRKYRYHGQMGMWDRYFNTYLPITPQTDENEN